jgi:hypothetical protein
MVQYNGNSPEDEDEFHIPNELKLTLGTEEDFLDCNLDPILVADNGAKLYMDLGNIQGWVMKDEEAVTWHILLTDKEGKKIMVPYKKELPPLTRDHPNYNSICDRVFG